MWLGVVVLCGLTANGAVEGKHVDRCESSVSPKFFTSQALCDDAVSEHLRRGPEIVENAGDRFVAARGGCTFIPVSQA